MAPVERGFQLGLLPERKVNKRTMAIGYGLVVLILLIIISVGLLLPERLELRQYHVTELIPLPAMRPEPEPIKRPTPMKKLLPAAKIPGFEKPKLLVPQETCRPAVEDGGRGSAPTAGAHGRLRGKFADADSKCRGATGANRGFR